MCVGRYTMGLCYIRVNDGCYTEDYLIGGKGWVPYMPHSKIMKYIVVYAIEFIGIQS